MPIHCILQLCLFSFVRTLHCFIHVLVAQVFYITYISVTNNCCVCPIYQRLLTYVFSCDKPGYNGNAVL